MQIKYKTIYENIMIQVMKFNNMGVNISSSGNLVKYIKTQTQKVASWVFG